MPSNDLSKWRRAAVEAVIPKHLLIPDAYPSNFGLVWKSVVIVLIPLLVSCAHDGEPERAPCGPADCTCTPDCTPQRASEHGLARSLVLPDGRLAIVTYDNSRGALVVVFQRPGSARRTLSVVTYHDSADVGRWAQIARESSGMLQVAWSEPLPGGGGLLRWAKGDEGGFAASEKISQYATSHLALRIDAADRPHIAFREDRVKAVRYATRRGSGWIVTGIQGCAGEDDCPRDDEDFGQGLDLALVASGGAALPRIAFYDAARGDLKLAGSDADGTWTTVTLDGADGADVGRFVSLAVTPTRSLGVAYFDATLGVLRYIGPNGTTSRVVDNGVDRLGDGRARRALVGQFCALDYDSQGSAHILYADTSAPGLRHARVPGEGAAVVTELAIPPGMGPSFEFVGGRLVGVYAAFVADRAPETSLRLFDLPASVGGSGDAP